MESTNNKWESWAIVELFGHTQIAGLVTEATIGGCSFVRVDVPEINGQPAFTKFYGNGAIYSMTPVGETEARMALEHIMPKPVSVYLLPMHKETGAPPDGPNDREEDDEDDGGDDDGF